MYIQEMVEKIINIGNAVHIRYALRRYIFMSSSKKMAKYSTEDRVNVLLERQSN
jgi:hypothetical protein